jgi:hypothetical protein
MSYELDSKTMSVIAFEHVRMQLMRPRVLIWLAFAYGWLLFVSLGDGFDETPFTLIASMFLTLVVVLLLWPGIIFLAARRGLKFVSRKTPNVTLEFLDEALVVRTDASESKQNYSLFDYYSRTRNGMLLFQDRIRFTFVPVSGLTPELEQFIGTVISSAPMKAKVRKKNPWLAALLNGVLYGSGYLYLGKKRLFATILIAADVLAAISLIDLQSISFGMWQQDSSYILITVALMVDAFIEARSVNKAKAELQV